ncbi:hypothetical protein [Celeribacter sp.]|uniref:hypothetical protein n=1 Tax=Celeribacter sp. TaxID=1890673 RepID=UPI003A90D918
MPWIIAIWLLVFIGQWVGPDRSRTIFGRIGFWLFWLAAILAVMLVIVTRRLSLFDWLLGLVALLPVIVIWAGLLEEQKRPRSVVLSLMLAGGAALVFIGFSTSSLIGLHNGRPMPLVMAGLAVALLSFLTFLVPVHAREGEIAVGTVAGLVLVVAAPLLVVSFSGYVSSRANAFYPDGACMEDSHGARFSHSLWISPRRLFFDSDSKGGKIPYLLLGADGGVAEHHWSFREMDFVSHDQGSAFSKLPSRRHSAPESEIQCVLLDGRQ